jgi:hypothetical protein
MKPPTAKAELLHACRRAAKAMGSAAANMRRESERSDGATGTLAAILRSDLSLSRADREMLAKLVTGQLNLGRGKGRAYGPSAKRDAEAAVRELRAKGGAPNLREAARIVARKHGLPESMLVWHVARSKRAKSRRS